MTKTTWRAFAAALAAVSLLGTSAFALETRTGYDPAVDFGSYKSYKWVAGSAAEVSFVQEQIERFVRSQIESKGLAEQGDADLWVVTHAAGDAVLQVDSQEYGYGYRWRSFGPTSVNFHNVAPGTLVVDLIEAKTKELVWAGGRRQHDPPQGQEEREEREEDPQGDREALREFPAATLSLMEIVMRALRRALVSNCCRSAVALLALVATASAPARAEVLARFLSGIDVSAFAECSWQEGRPAENHQIEEVIRTAVESELTRLGYSVTPGRERLLDSLQRDP